jgi:hypothetical protein
MNRMITALTVMSFALGAAAYAGTPSRDAATPVAPSQSSSAPSSAASRLTYSSESIFAGGPASNPNVPGATGRSIVLGNHSTIAGDSAATQMERTGAYGE